ncbi:transcriptional regulator [Acetobacteraceae bacterium H6797]|nr:transcriptional regulator [Acetobacteraceae bacterium H6797]
MSGWQFGLLLLGALWALQSLGTWLQMRHYTRIMGGILRDEPSGFVGTGAARGTIAKGVVAIVVSGPDEKGEQRTRRVLLMEGRSMLARFRPAPELEGLTLEELAALDMPAGRQTALRAAIARIEATRHPEGNAPASDTALSAPAGAVPNPA